MYLPFNDRRTLSCEQVRECRRDHGTGTSKVDLAARYGVSRRHISNIVRSAQYASVEAES